MRLAILLATYNSERFIQEQIDSLYNQSYQDFHIYIRDDGSIDSTIELITTLTIIKDNVSIVEDRVKGRGAMGSFIYLLENTCADYYMFCDHDDVWLPSKIEVSLNKIKEIETKGQAALVCTDLSVVDEKLKVIDSSMWRNMKLCPNLLIQKKFAASINLFTGCTMIINNQAKRVCLPISSQALMHDSWIGQRVISCNGVVGYISEPQILYRQHSTNVCGATHIITDFKHYFDRLLNFKRTIQRWMVFYESAKIAFDGNLTLLSFLFWRVVYVLLR